MHVEAEHVRQWLTVHPGRILDVAQSRVFAAHLEGLAWNSVGSGLDWSGLPALEVDLNSPTAARDIASGRLARHGQVFFLYDPDEPGLVTTFGDAIESLDELFWKAPGRRYLCGADLVGDQVQLAVEDLAEYDGAQRLTVRL
jgi:hypothetical protein